MSNAELNGGLPALPSIQTHDSPFHLDPAEKLLTDAMSDHESGHEEMAVPSTCCPTPLPPLAVSWLLVVGCLAHQNRTARRACQAPLCSMPAAAAAAAFPPLLLPLLPAARRDGESICSTPALPILR
jgi:hypothetical protein